MAKEFNRKKMELFTMEIFQMIKDRVLVFFLKMVKNMKVNGSVINSMAKVKYYLRMGPPSKVSGLTEFYMENPSQLKVQQFVIKNGNAEYSNPQLMKESDCYMSLIAICTNHPFLGSMIFNNNMINRDSIQTYHSQKTEAELKEKLIVQENIATEAPAVTSPTETVAPPKQRLNSLDILRGLTMLGMILVDNMGPYPPWYLDHAEWNGVTPADFIFPSFLFIMGMAVPLAMSKSKPFSLRSMIRILALFAIGVFLNLSARKFTFNHFRILGILQRLSICYGLLAIVHCITRYGEKTYRFIGTLIAIAAGVIYISFMVPFQNLAIGCPHSKNLEKFCNFGAYVDRQIFGEYHMIYPNDPEGLFTNLSAFLNAFAGYTFCLIMMDNKGNINKVMKLWVIGSLIMGAVVYPLTIMMPLNKKIWSISFVFLTSAVSGLSLTFITFFVDVLGGKHPKYGRVINVLTTPFVWLGRNPLAIFILMDVLAIIMIKYIIVNEKSAWAHFYHYAFATWITNKEVASTIYACFFAILWTAVAALLFKFNIFVRL